MDDLTSQIEAILPEILPTEKSQAILEVQLINLLRYHTKEKYPKLSILIAINQLANDPNSILVRDEPSKKFYQRATRLDNEDMLVSAITDGRWKIIETISINGRNPQYFPINELQLTSKSKNLLNQFPNGIYKHQKESIAQFLSGQNICITTGTASGKTLTFHIAAIEQLVRNPSTRIIAIYPMKALGREQVNRWKKAFIDSSIDAKVGVIDGNVFKGVRLKVLRESNVVVFTPDIIHAWLLSNLSEPDVVEFLKNVNLVIVDEIHTYTGVFGSHSAFLFRRLQHILSLLGSNPQYVCASATIKDPQKLLSALFGLNFEVILQSADTSPKHPMDLHFCQYPNSDLLSGIVALIENLSSKTNLRFITFADSRKQVELIASIMSRQKLPEEPPIEVISIDELDPKAAVEDKSPDLIDDEKELDSDSDIINKLHVLPYRSGYEEVDRQIIQQRLTEGQLAGVISTSALELGIDIPYLEICVLIGVPKSSTSLYQRIGRVGRHSKGHVIIINTGDLYDQAIFSNPISILDRPLAESTLYLDNIYIQYIHTLCLARIGGEHDQIIGLDKDDVEFTSSAFWPQGFIELCLQERSGQIPRDLQNKKIEAGDNPNYFFPLRDVESQFKVEHKTAFITHQLGSLSYRQVMREAYPGAVYYYATQSFRVYRVNIRNRQIYVKASKKYTTKPNIIPTRIFPNFTEDNVHQCYKHGSLITIECNALASEFVNGFIEKRGQRQYSYKYPLYHDRFRFEQGLFSRNFFTSGVIISHPIFMDNNNLYHIAELIFEGFLLLVPLEKQDVDFASDTFKLKIQNLFDKNQRFIAIFDQTYGSLRLSGKVLQNDILPKVFLEARNLAETQDNLKDNSDIVSILQVLYESSLADREIIDIETGIVAPPEKHERIILPESKGLLASNNQEFFIERVFLSLEGLRYEGYEPFNNNSELRKFPLVVDVIEIPGESKIGFFNLNTGKTEFFVEESVRAFQKQ